MRNSPFLRLLPGIVFVAALLAAPPAAAQNLHYFYSARLRMPECRAIPRARVATSSAAVTCRLALRVDQCLGVPAGTLLIQ